MFENNGMIIRNLDTAIDLIKVDEAQVALKYIDHAVCMYSKLNWIEMIPLNKMYERRMEQINDMLIKA